MTANLTPLDQRWFYGLVIVGVLLNATGLFPPVMELDGALYACIAKHMAVTGDFVNLYAVGPIGSINLIFRSGLSPSATRFLVSTPLRISFRRWFSSWAASFTRTGLPG